MITAIEALRIFGPLTLDELADRLGVGRGDAERRLRLLVDGDHAARVAEAGGYAGRPRAAHYDVTDKGRRIVAAMHEHARRTRAAAASPWHARLPVIP